MAAPAGRIEGRVLLLDNSNVDVNLIPPKMEIPGFKSALKE